MDPLRGLSISFDFERLATVEENELVECKRKLIQRVEPATFELYAPFSSSLLTAVRIYHFTEKDLYFHGKYLLHASTQGNGHKVKLEFVSSNNETRSLIYLWKALKASESTIHPNVASQVTQHLIERISELAKSSSGHFEVANRIDTDEATIKFHKWVNECWSESSELKMAHFGELRGLSTPKTLYPGDVVLELPREYIISEKLLSGTPLEVLFDIEGLASDIFLVFWLISEYYNPDSKFRAYLDILPMKFDTALYFTPAELNELEGTQIGAEIQAYNQKHEEIFEAVFPPLLNAYPHLLHPKMYCQENYYWVQSVIDSRGIKLNLDGEAFTCLLLLVDLINGSKISFLEGNTSIDYSGFKYPIPDKISSSIENMDGKGQRYIIRSLSEIPAGGQIFMNYGPFSNRELLLFYGFVQDDNPYDVYSFNLDLDDQFGAVQELLMNKLGLKTEHDLKSDGLVSPDLLMTIAILLLSEKEIAELLKFDDLEKLNEHVFMMATQQMKVTNSLKTLLLGLRQSLLPIPTIINPSTKMRNVLYHLLQDSKILDINISRL